MIVENEVFFTFEHAQWELTKGTTSMEAVNSYVYDLTKVVGYDLDGSGLPGSYTTARIKHGENLNRLAMLTLLTDLIDNLQVANMLMQALDPRDVPDEWEPETYAHRPEPKLLTVAAPKAAKYGKGSGTDYKPTDDEDELIFGTEVAPL